MQTRLERTQARHDTRDWVQERRARTRQLIELGGLVHKAGLVELTGDDRATLLGAMMELADQLRGGRDAGTSADARTQPSLPPPGGGAACGPSSRTGRRMLRRWT